MLTRRKREGAFKSRGSARVGIDFLPHLLGFEAVPVGQGATLGLWEGFLLFDWESWSDGSGSRD